MPNNASNPTNETAKSVPQYVDWGGGDVEQWFGAQGARFTNVNLLLTAVVAILLTIAFYMSLIPAHGHWLADMFTERGPTQHVTIFFFLCCAVMLIVKMNKIAVQRRALSVRLIPSDPAFDLTPDTVGEVVQRLRDSCDDPRRFFLLNRIDLALSNLRNMGRIGDFEGVLDSQASSDEDVVESSYGIIKGLNWAIPVLGFIGTVLGLSVAIAKFGDVLANSGDVATIKPALQGVTGGLATAFETTLVALVAALIIQLWMTFVKRSEERLLDDCKEYCQRQLVARLRFGAVTAPPASVPRAAEVAHGTR